MAKLPKIHPEFFKKYRLFADDVWQKGVIPHRDKEIIAVSVTAVTKCSYCTKFHSVKARQAGVTPEELIEGVIVATSVETGNALLPSLPAEVFEGIGVTKQTERLKELYPDQYEHLEELLLVPFAEASGVLSNRLILLIAYAAAHALRSAEYIRKLAQFAPTFGVSQAELREASLIAAALRAGSTIRHSADILETFE
mgnify:CR=1 FL=1